eukprot:jgi/Mesen1/5565/ME000280S04682
MDADGFFTLDSGALMPAVGFGTWQAVDGKGKDAVLTALSVGYRSLDCAHLYGNERDVGEALKEAFSGAVPGLKREDVFLTSKLWCTNSSPKRVAQACERSLKNLGTSYLDLFLLHWPIATAVPDATDPPPGAERRPRASGSIRATWQAMEALVDAGHVRAIGLSNFSIRQIEDLLAYAKIVPSVNQEELLKYCQQLGIHVSAHTPLGTPGRVCHVSPRMGSPAGPAASQGGGSAAAPGGDSADGGGSGDEANSNGNGNGIRGKSSSSGFGSGSTSGSGAGSRSGRKSVSVYAPMLKDSVVVGLAEKYRKTPAQILLRWGVQRGTSVLPRSVRPERIRSNFEVLGWELAPADWELVNSMEPQQCLIDGTYSYLAENWPFHALVEEDEELDLKETLAGDGGAPAPGGAANGSTPMGPAASQAAAAVAGAEADVAGAGTKGTSEGVEGVEVAAVERRAAR